MPPFEDNTHVFIVRIWCEPCEIERAVPELRGVIEHVPSGKRRYLKELEEVGLYMMPYLEAMGLKFGLSWRLRQWLRQRKLARTRPR